MPPAGSVLSPEPKSETTETASGLSSGAGNAPAAATAGTGPQTLDLVLTYAGDAAKVGSLEQVLYDLVKAHGTHAFWFWYGGEQIEPTESGRLAHAHTNAVN